MSFDLSWDTLAVLKGGMGMYDSGADPTRDRGCTQLLPCVVVFEWNKQAPLTLGAQSCVCDNIWALLLGN